MEPKCAHWLCIPVLLIVGVGSFGSAAASDEVALPKDVPSLIKLLRDKDPKLRASAARELGHMGGKAGAAVPALILLLDDDEVAEPQAVVNGRVCDEASWALAWIGQPAVDALIKALANPNVRICEQAAITLARMQSPPKEALPALLRLFGHSSADVRHQAVSSIEEIGTTAENAIPQLIELAKNDSENRVRRAAIAATAALDGDGKRGIPVCIKALQDIDPDVRGQAARSLGNYGSRAESAIAALTLELDDKGERHHWLAPDFCGLRAVRYDAAEALGKIGHASSALPKLHKMLETDEGREVRAIVAQAVLRIDPTDKKALPALVKILQVEHEGTGGAEATLAVLESLGPAAVQAIGAIKKAVQDKNSYIPSVILEISPDDENYDIRGAAAKALAAVAGKDAAPLLVEQLKREREAGTRKRAGDQDFWDNDSVCANIAAALGKLGPEAAPAVPLLSAVLADSHVFSYDKEDAIETLGAIGPAAKDAVPHLIKVLDDEDAVLREKAAVALGRIGPAAKAAVPRLLKVSQSDAEDDLRTAARAAIRRIAPDTLPP